MIEQIIDKLMYFNKHKMIVKGRVGVSINGDQIDFGMSIRLRRRGFHLFIKVVCFTLFAYIGKK